MDSLNLDYLPLVIEECSEVIKAATKITRFGLDSTHPDGGPTNREELVQEVGDVIAVLQRLGLRFNIEAEPDLAYAIAKKLGRLEKYGPEAIRFNAWFDELVHLANEKGMSYLLGAPSDHRRAFDDGLSPVEELAEHIDAAREAA